MPNLYLNTGRSAGEEMSSGDEGRHLSIEESLLTHPTHADGFVDGGDPVIVGARIVAVAMKGAAAVTDYIALDTEGIWWLTVLGSDDAGNSAVVAGDEIFINTTTAVLSKITNIATQIPFGYALGAAGGGSTTTVVAVKVHHDPSIDNQVAKYNDPVASGAYGWSMRATLADPGSSEGLSMYLEGHVEGVQNGLIYNLGSWINVDAGSTLVGTILTPLDTGVYTAEAEAAARIVFGGQHMAILTGAPASLHCWRLNATQTVDAVIAAANPGSVGYVASGATGGAKLGGVPMFDIVGAGVRWVRLYASGI